MKTLITIVMVLGFGFSANASIELKEITCYTKAKFKDVRKIRFTDLLHADDLVEPNSTVPDASLTDWTIDRQSVSMVFSNECDNQYGFSFSRKDLEKLALGKVKKIKSSMAYAQLIQTDNDPFSLEENDVEMTCYKTK